MKASNAIISTDGICIYVSVSVNNPIVGKIALIVADLFIVAVASLALKEGITGLILVSIATLAFLIRYTLWSFFGKENLVINTKSLSYQHDYGFFKTSYVTKPIGKKVVLVVGDTGEYDVNQQTQLKFVSYREADDLPFEIYTMSFYVSADDANQMNRLIEKLYFEKMSDDYSLPFINLN